MAEITINNIKINANEGEYLLNVARTNGIFIPALCYLSGCSPTLACKLCMVEADGKRVYSCNVKIKDGMNITTNTPEINAERKAIMQSYCVNHPLECGVCDKSGECELQDFVLLFGVDNQSYFVADSLKKIDGWGQVKYDPNLCILCERCVTTCKDNLGEANLKVVKSDSIPQPDGIKWKEKMPKDAFSVWNRTKKGVIAFVGENPCNDCVECVSVCPVGALGVKSFQYSTNAWELQKVDSTCNLCPAGCKITLEGKKDTKNKMRLYRVGNDFDFNPICAAGRFGQELDWGNLGGLNINDESISYAINAIKGAKVVKVGGNTTNNEAKFLQCLKNTFGIKLVNVELENYFRILDILGDTPRATLESIAQQKLIITVSGNPKYENPLIRYKINNTLKTQKDCAFVFAHVLGDNLLAALSKKILDMECGSDECVILAICGILESSILENLPKTAVDFKVQKEVKESVTEIIKDENGVESTTQKEIIKNIESIEKREYYEIFSKCGLEYTKFLELQKMLENTTPLLIIGSDFYSNKNASYLAKILANLANNGKINLMLNPPSSNANGMYMNLALDCNESLGDFSDSNTAIIGWREKGDFTFDSVNADFTLPYFSAINDSIVNLDNRLLPINAIFPASKYLESLCVALDLQCDFRTPPLANFYANSGKDMRGVILEHKTKDLSLPDKAEATHKFEIDSHESLRNSRNIKDNTQNAYLRDITPHFYPYTRYCGKLTTPFGIYISKDKMQDLALQMGINVGDTITLNVNDIAIRAKIYIDFEMESDFFAISPQIDGVIKAFKNAKFAIIDSINKDFDK